MNDLVERLRQMAGCDLIDTDVLREAADALEAAQEDAASWRRIAERLENEKQDALEAAQARIEVVRKEAVDLCISVVELRTENRIGLHSDRFRAPNEIKEREAKHIIGMLRALTEAKEDRT